jgi:flap endonuclease-1
MGIKNFIKLIEKYSPSSITYTNISKYQNKILGIDANLMIYKMVYAIRQNGYDIKNGNISVTHIHTLLLKLIGFVKYNITPVFVFDGLAPQIKNETLRKRKIVHKTAKKKYDEATTEEEKKKYYLRYEITDEEMNDCKQLITMFNYSIIDSVEEADSQLVELLNCGKIDYIVTDDMDILVFGGGNILKNFTVSSNKKIQEINLAQFKKDTNLTQNMIIDISILMGCDYCTSAYGIGPIKSYELIMKYGDIESIIKKSHVEINIDYKFTRTYFLKPNVIECKDLEKFRTFKKCDKEVVENFLKKWNFDDKYIDKICGIYCG